VVAAVVADAAPPVDTRPARLLLETDVWCNLFLNGRGYGRQRDVEVAPGTYRVECTQGVGNPRYTDKVTVGPGEVKRLRGTLIQPVAVTVAVGSGRRLRVQGKLRRNGTVIRLKPGSHPVEVEANDGSAVAKGWITVPTGRPCTVRMSPKVACYTKP
jgi:hypothetical protein